jgi:hypothetical protein
VRVWSFDTLLNKGEKLVLVDKALSNKAPRV